MSIYKSEQTHPIILLEDVLRRYGIECFEWEPAVFKATLAKDTKSSIAKVNIHKIMAAVTVADTDRFWNDWTVFHYVSQCLNNNIPAASHIQDFSVGELMVAVDIANSIRTKLGKASQVPEFSEEIAKFVAAQALEAGVWFLPNPLEFAQPYAAKRMSVCKDCGNHQFYVEKSDRVCYVCTEKYDTESLKSMKPSKDKIKKRKGINTVIVEKNPIAGVSSALDKYLMGRVTEFPVTPDGICAGKIIVGLEYLTLRRSQYREQSS